MAFEPTLKDSLDLAKGKMNQQWKFLEKKIRQAAAKRNETAIQQLRKAVDNLYPNQRLQERVFNIVPYLIKYGYAFMDKLDQAIDIDEHDHQVLLDVMMTDSSPSKETAMDLDALAFGAHADDVELACGGTLDRVGGAGPQNRSRRPDPR